MNSTVEMFRDSTERKGRDRFSCSLAVWNLLQEVASEFGWMPRGSTYRVVPGTKHTNPALRDYEPGEAVDPKQVSEEDALAWANALAAAIESPRLSGILMRRAPPDIPHLVLIGDMKEFAEYCYGGAFVFALS